MHGLRPLIADVWRGRTILRSLADRLLAETAVLRGLTVDLGGAESGYLDLLRHEGGVRRIVVDLRPESGPTLVADLEHPLPFVSATIDTLLLHNVLEHIRNYRELVNEMRRVARTGARVYFSVPFLLPIHELEGGYSDYQRLTARALIPLFAPFTSVELQTIEAGPFTAALNVAFSAVPFRPLRVALVVAAHVLDATYGRLRRRRDPRTQIHFVLGYVGVAIA